MQPQISQLLKDCGLGACEGSVVRGTARILGEAQSSELPGAPASPAPYIPYQSAPLYCFVGLLCVFSRQGCSVLLKHNYIVGSCEALKTAVPEAQKPELPHQAGHYPKL